MAIPIVKATYSLDVNTVKALERMAKRWAVSKSEALRRAIRAAAANDSPDGAERAARSPGRAKTARR